MSKFEITFRYILIFLWIFVGALAFMTNDILVGILCILLAAKNHELQIAKKYISNLEQFAPYEFRRN